VNRALFAAASGMAAQQQNLDVIADNLANADVAGFKSAQAVFEAIGGDASLGTASAGTHRIFSQGKLMKTGGAFDVAIDGSGFFAVERDGKTAYTRAGSFGRAGDGTLRTPDGWTLCGVKIPASALDVTVAANGRVTATLGAHATPTTVGTIRLHAFVAPERLQPLGSALFAPTADSGSPRAIAAGGEHQPKISFGMLERSNVSTIESMMALLAAQRAYEANAKAVQASDEMLRIANNLHRS
jgi:flagellar basal-body rod protein FlgG